MQQLKVARYQFNFELLTPLHLNFYAGSMLRGAFGHALRQVSCMTKMSECKACALYQTCPYPRIFEPAPPKNHPLQKFSQVPPPYVIEPPAIGSKDYQTGEIFSFSMVLIGQALAELPLIIYAWQVALARGLGKSEAKGRLLNVVLEADSIHESVIYVAEEGASVAAHQPVIQNPIPNKDSLTLRFNTPLQIRKKNKIVGRRLTAQDFLISLLKRYDFLREFHGEADADYDFSSWVKKADMVSAENCFKRCDWRRYSNRQQQLISLHGVIGEITLQGDLSPFFNVLSLGQWLHVGKETVFGMGGYELVTER